MPSALHRQRAGVGPHPLWRMGGPRRLKGRPLALPHSSPEVRLALVALCRRLGWAVDEDSPANKPARQICDSASVSATSPIEPTVGLNVDWAVYTRQGSAGEIVPWDASAR